MGRQFRGDVAGSPPACGLHRPAGRATGVGLQRGARRTILLTIAALGVFSGTALPAQAAPAPDCNVPPTQCSPDGNIRIGFSQVTPAQVVDVWKPIAGSYPVVEYNQSTGANGGVHGLSGPGALTFIETVGGFSHYQGIFPGETTLTDDPGTKVIVRFGHPDGGQEHVFNVVVTAPAAGFNCSVEGTKVLTGVCSFEARRDGIRVDSTLAVERKKRGKPWKPYRSAEATEAFSALGPQAARTLPLKIKCKPGRKYRVTASGNLFTAAAGIGWLSDFATSPPAKVKCPKK